MKNILRVSLQTKILVLIIALILFVIILLTAISSYLEYKETRKQMKQLALQTAKMVSYMPTVKEALRSDHPSPEIQGVAERVRDEVNAATVIIANRNGVIYSYPDPDMIGKQMESDDNYKALVLGGYYNTETKGRLGKAIRGKAPIFVDYETYRKLEGVVSVGFLQKEIRSAIVQKILKSSLFALFVLAVGIIGGILLAKNIKKETLGLEPYEIASLYRERNAILSSVKEGILAIDEHGLITMLNKSAQNILGLSKDAVRKPIRELVPETEMLKLLETGAPESNREMFFKEKVLIVNRTPVIKNERIVGVVSSFRDKTEIQDMIDTLSEVRKYSEDLRAQTHEFTNKLYVLSGLLQLGQYTEAINMIQKESNVHSQQNRILFDQIHDAKVQAILLGKLSKASEKKIDFNIDSNSSLDPLPPHVKISQLITIIGNLIDNAFEAVQGQEQGEVGFFTIDMGDDIVIEISDNGPGVPKEAIEHLFDKGFSSKGGNNRGYGLANVRKTVRELNGTIDFFNSKEGGAIFTTYIPKANAYYTNGFDQK
ncbi:MAG TPA: sensor histidine kinase [Bacillales bacterium]|nr:sensor histidine kinase [Bacillales bacterium]